MWAGSYAAALYVLGPGGRDVLARLTELKTGRVTKKWGNLREQSVEDLADELREEGATNLSGIEAVAQDIPPVHLFALSGATTQQPEGPQSVLDQAFGPRNLG